MNGEIGEVESVSAIRSYGYTTLWTALLSVPCRRRARRGKACPTGRQFAGFLSELDEWIIRIESAMCDL
jgi:hypothetical protein